MDKRKSGSKKRKFYILLKSRSAGTKRAIELVGKHGKKYAFAKARTIAGDNWEILLVLARGACYSGFFVRDNWLELKKRISKGNFKTI